MLQKVGLKTKQQRKWRCQMADKTIIYYYSGSGNSLSVAKHIGEKLGNTTLLSVYTLRDNPEVPQEYTRIGIVTATWFVRPPRIVKEVCEKLQCSRQQKIFILATCGGYDGFVCIDLKAILQPKTDFLFRPLCCLCRLTISLGFHLCRTGSIGFI